MFEKENEKKKTGCAFIMIVTFFLCNILIIILIIHSNIMRRKEQYSLDMQYEVKTVEPKLESPYWVANKATGLYAKAEKYSNILKILSAGDIVIVPNGNSKLSCRQVKDEAYDEEFCLVQVFPDGEIGWVLIKRFDSH